MFIERYKAPVSTKANASEFALYTFSIGKNNYVNKSSHDALLIISRYIKYLNSQLSTAIQTHSELLNIKSESFGLVAVTDFIAGAKMPLLSIWDPITEQTKILTQLLSLQNIPALLIMLRYTSGKYEENYKQLEVYMQKNQNGYDTGIETLTIVKKGAEMTIGGYNPFIGGGYTFVLSVVTQATELHYNMRDEIDWAGITIDLAIDELFSLVANKISDKIIESLNLSAVQPSLPFTLRDRMNNFRLLAPNIAKKKVVDLVVNKYGSVICGCLKAAIQQQRDLHKPVTWELITNTTYQQFSLGSMSKSGIEEILSAAMGK